MTEMLKTNRRHFTDPDYGILIDDNLGRVVVRLHYVTDQGEVLIASPTWVFYSEASKATALVTATQVRDDLLRRPEFQAYIARSYADPSGRSKFNVRPSTLNERGVVPNLKGIFVRVNTKHPRVKGRPVNYVNIIAHGPGANGKTKYKAWSVRKYGLSVALELAARWRAEYVTADAPTPSDLMAAESAIRARFRGVLSDGV